MVIFFELTNPLTMFQIMINEILQNLINTEEVASFIDNVIVGTEKEKAHDEVVKKVVKWLMENNLYIKPEKCKWKIREVGFLEVVIELEEIKMKEVLKWSTLKGVKDI